MRCRTCQQRIRRELENCPYCGGRIKQASTGRTRHLSPQQLATPLAPTQRLPPQIAPHLITLLILGVLAYCMLWVVRWPLGTPQLAERNTIEPHFFAMYLGFTCAFFLPFTVWRGCRWRSLLLACGAAVALVMRMNMG